MELTNEFVIDRGLEETWAVLNDLEFIAPCMPGAQLQEIEGDEYRGVVKVKVGPITAQYKGKATFIEQDAANKVARMKAEGRDPRQGNANAMITAKMEAIDESRTSVNIHTDLGLSGKIASFGRGAIEDVSKKILGQFTENLRTKLEETGTVAAPGEAAGGDAVTGAAASGADAPDAASGGGAPEVVAPSPSPGSESVSDPSTPGTGDDAGQAASPQEAVADAARPTQGGGPAANGTSGSAASGEPAVRKIDSGEVEPVDLLAVSSGAVAKRAVPAAGVAAIVLAILYWLISRG